MSHMKQKSVTIGISACNEENNIAKLLAQLLKQKQIHYILKEIIVISDGSADDTVEEAQRVKDKRIKIMAESERKGKYFRLQQIFTLAKSDLIVILDADTLPFSDYTVDHLIRPFLNNKKVGLTAGKAQPKEGRTFVEKCINASYEAYDYMKPKIRKGNSPYSAEGRIYCVSKKFAGSVIFRESINDDNYIYFSCIANGYVFRYIQNAVIWYRSPSTLQEHISQNTRFLSREYSLLPVFGDLVELEYALPKLFVYKAFLRTFFKKPVYSLGILCINFYCKYNARHTYKNNIPASTWNIVSSTKKGL